LNEACNDVGNATYAVGSSTGDGSAETSDDISKTTHTADLHMSTNGNTNCQGNVDTNSSNKLLQITNRGSYSLPSSDPSQGFAQYYNSIKRVYECKLCARQFRHVGSLRSHMKAHSRDSKHVRLGGKCHAGGKRIYRCKLCGYASPLGFHVLRHLRNVHGQQVARRKSGRRKIGATEDALMSTETENDVNRDGDTESNASKVSEEAATWRTELLGNESSQFEARQLVPRASSSKSNDPLHELTRDASTICRLCGKQLARKCALKRHIREVHLRMKCPHRITKANRHLFKQCPSCATACKTDQGLRRHMEWHKLHPDPPVFQCDKCSRCFKTAGALKMHSITHSTERPYLCQTCAKAFRTVKQLQVHETAVHSGTRPYCCETCGARFAAASSFVIHKRLHSGVKAFWCGACGKTFLTSSQLKDHVIVMHTNDKPYSCPVCYLTFGLRRAMRRHVKVRHGVILQELEK